MYLYEWTLHHLIFLKRKHSISGLSRVQASRQVYLSMRGSSIWLFCAPRRAKLPLSSLLPKTSNANGFEIGEGIMAVRFEFSDGQRDELMG